MEDSNPELESFRQKWRAEVSAKSRGNDSKIPWKTPALQNAVRDARRPPAPSTKSAAQEKKDDEEEDDEVDTAPEPFHLRSKSGSHDDVEGFASTFGHKEPKSALEHYEKAVEREDQGSLGDSLSLYRKAFKMDHRVDLAYKNRYHPPTSIKGKMPSKTNQPTAMAAEQISAHNTSETTSKLQTFNELIAGFSALTIQAASPEVEGTPAPPCPIADLPDEIIIHVLTQLAVMDVAAYVRAAQVCKRFAYLVATEEQPWKRVCLGSEVGFAAMHYDWQTEIEGGPLEGPGMDDLPVVEDETIPERQPLPNTFAITSLLQASIYNSSWRQMFRQRPRIRFNGCYISTVNYIRPGQASTNQLTWNSPVHIVTYYRYLRFFRDGTVLSLCATNEPIEVIPYLTKDFTKEKLKVKPTADPSIQLPASVMNSCHRGRWRISTAVDHPDGELKDAEGEVYVETEGVGTKYVYRMELNFRSVGKAARNNKLAWKSYWHYNKLTDDWGEFGLRNDKAFFWSRVKSWGMGE